MASPSVASTNTTASTTANTTVNMPASIAAGDALVIVVRGANSNSPGGTISGFTKVADLNRSGGGSGTLCVFTKLAVGSDTATYVGSAENRVTHAYRITGWLGDITGVKVATLGTGLLLDPPNLDTGVTDDWLWLTFGSPSGGGSDSVTAAPTNYTNFLGPTSQSTTHMGSARRALNASAENPGIFTGVAGTSSMLATIAIPPVEVFGDIVFGGSGAIDVTASSLSVPYPSGISAGDLLVLVAGQKPATANGGTSTVNPADPPFDLAGSLTGAGGYGATLGADTGNTNLYVYTRVTDGTESGTLHLTLTDSSVAWGQMHRLSSAVGDEWDIAVATGSDTTAGAVSVTFGSDPGVEAEDYVIGALCIPTDVTTPSQFSAQALSQTGVTFDVVREISEPDTASGNDLGGMMCRARVLSGTSSAVPVLTATAGGTTTNVRGPAAFIRVRRVTSGGPPEVGGFLPFFL